MTMFHWRKNTNDTISIKKNNNMVKSGWLVLFHVKPCWVILWQNQSFLQAIIWFQVTNDNNLSYQEQPFWGRVLPFCKKLQSMFLKPHQLDWKSKEIEKQNKRWFYKFIWASTIQWLLKTQLVEQLLCLYRFLVIDWQSKWILMKKQLKISDEEKILVKINNNYW